MLLAQACMPAYVPTIAPEDATFALSCIAAGCGAEGREDGVAIDVVFGGQYTRQLAFCCSHRAEILSRLQTVADLWCDGLDVPEVAIGPVVVGTTVSEGTGKRGATIDVGEGFVAFNCDAWLPELIEQLASSECCGGG